jgi:hypothetical protein
MSKNLIRKGLAFGALVALGSTVIAGSPAFAIEPVSLDPTAGTSYSTILGESFGVTSLFTDAAQLGTESLKFLVTDSSSKLDLTAVKVNGSNASSVTLDSNKQFVVTGNATQAPASNALVLKASSAAVTAAASFSATVQAFLDYNANGILDSGEAASSARTINWIKASSVTATTTVASAYEADTSATAKVSFDGINNEQLDASHVGVNFTNGDDTALALSTSTATAASSSGTAITFTAPNSFVVGQIVNTAGFTAAGFNLTNAVVATASATQFTVTNSLAAATASVAGTAVAASPLVKGVAWSSIDSFKYAIGNLSALDKTKLLKVQPLYSASGSLTSSTTIGASVLGSIVARQIASNGFTSGIVVSNTAGVISSANKVALNKSFQVYAKAVDGSSPAVAIAGKTVSFSITDAALPANAAAVTSSTANLTVNGVTYTSVDTLPGATGVAKLTGVTNSDGKLVVNVSATGHADTNTIVFNFAAENLTSSVTVVETALTAVTATITSGSASATTVGGTVAVSVQLQDVFGNAVADTYDAKAHFGSSSGGRTTANVQANDVIVPIVGGVATLNLTDNGTGLGTNTYAIQYQKRDAALGGYGANSAVAIDGSYVVNIKSVVDLTPGVVSLAISGGVSAVTDANSVAIAGQYKASAAVLATGDFATADYRNPQTVAASTASARLGAGQVLTASVSSASSTTYVGVSIPTSQVTYSLAGAQFSTGGSINTADEIDTIGSITVPSGTAVKVWSHIAGAQTVTVTSGSVTSTVVVTFPAAAAGSGKTWIFTAPATAQSGTTVNYSAILVDKFGNAVEAGQGSSNTPGATTVSFSATTIVGAVSAAVAKTDSTGKVAGSATTQVLDAGNLVITAVYDVDGSATTTTDRYTATATIVVSDLAGAAKAAADKAAADKAAADKAAADKAAADKAAADAAAALAAMAKTVTATASATTSQTGRAVDVTVKVVNNAGTAGAGRTVNFTSTGAGSLTVYSAVTDANGVATVKLLSGAADNGDAVVTATVDGVTATAGTVTFGTTDANVDIVNNRVTAVASFTKGKTVGLYVDGIKVWSKASASDSDVVLNYNLKKGTHTVTVKISGGFTTTEKFIVK